MAAILSGCTSSASRMEVYVPHACHGSAAPFSTYALEFVDVPGFIEDVIATSARGALAAVDLEEASVREEADLRVINTFYLIDRNPPPSPEDPMGEAVPSPDINRFIAHLNVDVVDQRRDNIIFSGNMYRYHAIRGGETFHDEHAVLIIRQAYDEMFVGLTAPCG